MKERLMESARYLSRIPALQHISITHDLTDRQRKEENSLWREAANQNLSPTYKMQEKGLVVKVVGHRGQRRIVMAPLKRTEEVDEEGWVRLRGGSSRREGARSRRQEQTRGGGRGAPVTGANKEPLGRKEQGNGQGAAVGRSSRDEQDSWRRTPGARGPRQLRPGQEQRMRTDMRIPSFGSEEGEEEREGRRGERGEKGRKENYAEASPCSLLQVPRFSTLPASLGLAEVRLQ